MASEKTVKGANGAETPAKLDVGPTPGVSWYKDWYTGVPVLCILNLSPGALYLWLEEFPYRIDPFVIFGWIFLDLFLLWAFAVQNLSGSDVKANLSALLFSISSVFAAIILFASRFKVNGLIDALGDKEIVKDAWSALYFSTVTWTTVGYGDLVPSKACRWYAAWEAMISYLYMALLLAQIIGLSRTARTER